MGRPIGPLSDESGVAVSIAWLTGGRRPKKKSWMSLVSGAVLDSMSGVGFCSADMPPGGRSKRGHNASRGCKVVLAGVVMGGKQEY